MIDPNFINEIAGLRELFSLVPEEYSFHDAELESAEWSLQDCELVVRYFCYYGLERQIHVTFYLKPEMNDFTIELSPHGPPPAPAPLSAPGPRRGIPAKCTS